jgi:hypothetical protein
MSSIDLIASSVKEAWNVGAYTGYCPTANIYFGRAQKPAQLSGFPYMEMDVRKVKTEVSSENALNYSLVTYQLTIDTFTAQGQTGGTTTGDQLTDQGNIVRSLEAVLNYITPNVPWNNVEGFLHCIPDGETVFGKAPELYLGVDVMTSKNQWTLLVTE